MALPEVNGQGHGPSDYHQHFHSVSHMFRWLCIHRGGIRRYNVMALCRFIPCRKYLSTLIHLSFSSAVLCSRWDVKSNIAMLEKEVLLLLLARF